MNDSQTQSDAWAQPMLPMNDSQVTQRERLRATRNAALMTEQELMSGKRLEVFLAISSASAGLTMREMAVISGRGINCWTQPFKDLRDAGVIEATDLRRNGGAVHQLVQGKVFKSENW